MASLKSKVKSAVNKAKKTVSSYAKNVSGGAKIVGSGAKMQAAAIKSTLNRNSGGSSKPKITNAPLSSGGTVKIPGFNAPTGKPMAFAATGSSLGGSNKAKKDLNTFQKSQVMSIMPTGTQAGFTPRAPGQSARSAYGLDSGEGVIRGGGGTRAGRALSSRVSNLTSAINRISRTGGGPNGMASAFEAIRSLSGNSTGNQGQQAAESTSSVNSTYQGRPATERITYSQPGGSAGGVSNEGIAERNAASTPEITPEERTANSQFIVQAEQERQTQMTDLQGQLEALQTQLATVQEEEERSSLEAEMERLNRELERVSVPSAEEVEARRLEDELTAREAEIKAGAGRSIAEIRDQPVPYGFITGQSTAVENRANADLSTIAAQRIPLQQRVANAQARRQAAFDVVKTKIANIDRKRESYEARRKERKDDLRYKEEQKRLGQFELGEGQARYDANGRLIASRPKSKTTTTKSPTPKAPKFQVSGSDIEEGTTALESSRGSDGHVNSALYLSLYRDWIDNGGSLSLFKTYFPPNSYVNPNDPTVPPYLRPTGGGNNVPSTGGGNNNPY